MPTPVSHFSNLPKAILERLVSGYRLVGGIVGDSISHLSNVGQGGTQAVAWQIGLLESQMWTEGVRGLFAHPGNYYGRSGVGGFVFGGGYSDANIRMILGYGAAAQNWFGVSSRNYDSSLCCELHWPGGGTPQANQIYCDFRLFGDGPTGGVITNASPTARSIALLNAPNLQAVLFVYRRHGEPVPDGMCADVVDAAGNTLKTISTPVSIPATSSSADNGWFPVVFDLSGMDLDAGSGETKSIALRLRSFGSTSHLAAGDYLYIAGVRFRDPDSDGAELSHLGGKGGWNTANFNFDLEGADHSSNHDTREAFGHRAIAAGFGDSSNCRVLFIAVGQNIYGNGQVSGNDTTSIFTDDFVEDAEQRVEAIGDAGGGVDALVLLGTHAWGPSGDSGEIQRAQTRCDRIFAAMQEIGPPAAYMGIPYAVSPWPSDHYFSVADYHLSAIGAARYGSEMWSAWVAALAAANASGGGAGRSRSRGVLTRGVLA